MTADKIYEFARLKQPAPDDLTLCERMLYTTARNIYKAYSDGIITLEQAKKEKNQSITAFGALALSERVYLEHKRRMTEISRVLVEAEKCGCEYCRKVSKLFDGRILNNDTRTYS